MQMDQDYQSIKKILKNDNQRKGDKSMLFDKKTMKLIRAEKIGEFMMKGQQVFMVMLDGSLVEINDNTAMENLFFHTLTGGTFAVHRKRFSTGGFAKTIKIGRWSVTLNHEEKGVDQDVFDAR